MSREEDIFLEKGLLEQYAMGHCTPEEREEVEGMLKSSKRIRKEYAEIQYFVDKLANTKAHPIPPHILEPTQTGMVEKNEKARVQSSSEEGFSAWKVAASIALLLATGLIFQQWNKNNHLQAEVDDLKEKQQLLIAENAKTQSQLASLEDKAAFIEHSRTQKFILNTDYKGQEFVLAAYWNDFAQKALLDPQSIPAPPDGHCYQLWADVEGVMVPVAIIKCQDLTMIEGRFYPSAESLNVTIEKAEGSDHATVENLVTSIEV